MDCLANDMMCIVIPTAVEGSDNVNTVLPYRRTHFAFSVFIRFFDCAAYDKSGVFIHSFTHSQIIHYISSTACPRPLSHSIQA